MDDSIPLRLLLQLILILFNAVFACAEIAVISFNDNKLAKMAAEGDKRAVRLAALTEKPARFLATIQVAITLSGFLGSAFAAYNFSDQLVNWLLSMGVPIPVKTLDTLVVVLITVILSYFTLILGELVPKRVAMQKAESLALGMSGLIGFISRLFAPIVWLLTISTNGILRLLGIDPDEEGDQVGEEEIRMMVDVGSEKGTIDKGEKEFIQNVFEFDDLTAEEIMTHRTEASILWIDEDGEQWKRVIHDDRHSFYPVCGETVDQVLGVLNAKDYFRLEDFSRESILKNAVKPAYFVPGSVKADVLFRNMKHKRERMAVVLDEYGGVLGLVTMNDLIKQLVGEFDEEPDLSLPEPEIQQMEGEVFKISGAASLDEVAKVLKLPLPCEEYDTFSGFIFGSLGAVPEDGSRFSLEAGGLSIKVLQVSDHRVDQALVSVLREESQNPLFKEKP